MVRHKLKNSPTVRLFLALFLVSWVYGNLQKLNSASGFGDLVSKSLPNKSAFTHSVMNYLAATDGSMKLIIFF